MGPLPLFNTPTRGRRKVSKQLPRVLTVAAYTRRASWTHDSARAARRSSPTAALPAPTPPPDGRGLHLPGQHHSRRGGRRCRHGVDAGNACVDGHAVAAVIGCVGDTDSTG